MESSFVTSSYVVFCRIFLKEVRMVLRDEGASLAQYRILKWVFQRDGISTGELAEKSFYVAGMVSRELKALRGKGYVDVRGSRIGGGKAWFITGRGISFFRRCDSAVNGTIDLMLSLLPLKHRRLVESSCFATAIAIDRVALRHGTHDYCSSCLESFLLIELIFTRSAHEWGIGVTSFEVLASLVERGNMSPSEICDRLVLKKSLLSEALRQLQELGLVDRRADRFDRRSARVFATERGQRLCDEVSACIDERLTKEIRRTDPGELAGWRELPEAFLVKYRSLK